LWEYASVAGLDIKLGIFVDPLSVFMVLIVTGVSTLIHLYSFGYMQSDEGYHRFFSYLNFFVFSMLLLVLAGNFVLLIVGWAFVDIAAFVGLATLLVAGTIALVMTDLKRAIAYSTMSQIGYMIMGVSIGAYSAGMFHLMTHAFFKALLFMAAGSIIAAMANNQNIDKMSGFGKAMKFTSVTMLCGGLALAAFPLTSGFFSKDEILAYASARGGMYLIFTIL